MKWLDRFWSKVQKSDGCWIWTAALSHGYGRFCVATDDMRLAHRVSYELARGPIPAGLVIDHLCRNRACVNPEHMEAVPDRVNVARGMSANAINARKDACRRGHPFTPENTKRRSDRPGHRECRTCAVAAVRAFRQQRRAA